MYLCFNFYLSKVGLELAPLMKAQPTGNPRKDPSTGYMMDAKLTSTDITKHAAQQTVQPWHSRENKSHYWTQLTGQVGQILETRTENSEISAVFTIHK